MARSGPVLSVPPAADPAARTEEDSHAVDHGCHPVVRVDRPGRRSHLPVGRAARGHGGPLRRGRRRRHPPRRLPVGVEGVRRPFPRREAGAGGRQGGRTRSSRCVRARRDRRHPQLHPGTGGLRRGQQRPRGRRRPHRYIGCRWVPSPLTRPLGILVGVSAGLGRPLGGAPMGNWPGPLAARNSSAAPRHLEVNRSSIPLLGLATARSGALRPSATRRNLFSSICTVVALAAVLALVTPGAAVARTAKPTKPAKAVTNGARGVAARGARGVAASDPLLVVGEGWSPTTDEPPAFFWTGTGQPFNDEGPYTFSSSLITVLSVTDDFQCGDRFLVFDNGVALGDTSVAAVDPTCLEVGPDDAFASPAYSHGTFLLPPGAHAITIQVIVNAFSGGRGY